MLMFEERPPAIGTLSGWASSVLRKAGAILECEEHGWTQDRADPHARQEAKLSLNWWRCWTRSEIPARVPAAIINSTR